MPRYLAAIDLQKNELRNARMQNLASPPASPVAGQLYYDTASNNVYFYDGTQWRASFNPTATPVGPAGGDLAGTYPNPAVAAGAIDDSKIATGAAIALSKLATDPLARANHTGSQLAATIADFDTQVRASRLDQLSIPNTAVNLNSQRLTNVSDPVNAQDAATKGYVDATATGLDVKLSVRAATTGNITLSGTQTIDAINLAVGDRVLVKNQTNVVQNGIYVVAAGSWARAADADSSAEVTPGMFTFVEEGASNSDSGWVLTTDAPISLGSTDLTFTQFTGAGQISAGNGLTQTGNTLDAVGTTGRINVGADSIDIDPGYIGQTSLTTLGVITTGTWQGTTLGLAYGGTGATTAAAARANLGAPTKVVVPIVGGGTSEVLTHGLGTRDVIVQIVQTISPYGDVEAQIERTTPNAITLYSDSALPASTYEAVIIG